MPFLWLGVAGVCHQTILLASKYSCFLKGLLGALFIKLNVAAALYRRNTQIREWPLLEVVAVTTITAVLSYMVRNPTYWFIGMLLISLCGSCQGGLHEVIVRAQLVGNVHSLTLIPVESKRASLSHICSKNAMVCAIITRYASGHPYFLRCKIVVSHISFHIRPDTMWSTIFLLMSTLTLKLGLTAWTFGMKVLHPAASKLLGITLLTFCLHRSLLASFCPL